MNLLQKLVLASSLLVQGMAATAAVIVINGGPAFPGPMNITGATHVGSVTSGGQTSTYPNIGTSAVANGYFGVDRINSGSLGFSGDGNVVSGLEEFTWFADTANSIEYRGQTSVPLTTGGLTLFTRLMLTAVSGATVVSDATTLGMPGVHSLFHITGSSFQVVREVEVSTNGTNWSDAIPYYNSILNKQPNNSTRSNVATGFYWENLQVTNGTPEPAPIALVGAALAALFLVRRARS